MKKAIYVLLSIFTITILAASEKRAEAQVIYSNQCCDSWNIVRCIQSNMTLVGSPCFCYGQGWGHTC